VWWRIEDKVVCQQEHYRPWLYAAHLDDLKQLGSNLCRDEDTSPFSYRELPGSSPALKYLLTVKDGRALEQLLLAGASKRLDKEITNLNSLDDYYQVAPVEQYLMQTGQTYFRELKFSDPHRL
jgi:DNA polymerase, archaea type